MQHWNDYWRYSGALNSFAESGASAGYSGEVASFWQHQLDDCSNEARIVDVGTGNGALAVLIAEYARNKNVNWQVTGTDAAAIEPAKSLQSKPELVAKLSGIQFLGDTPVERLPFAEGSIDLVTSQFAFEYSDMQAGLREVFRVLKPGGKFVVMAHHQGSELVLDSKRGIEIFDYILDQTPLFMQLDLLFNLAAGALTRMDNTAWNKTQECIAATKSIQWTMSVINERFAQPGDAEWVNDVFGQAIQLIRSVQSAESANVAAAQLAQFYAGLKNHHMRIKEQVEVALNVKKIVELEKILRDLNGELSVNSLSIDDDLFAYTLIINKLKLPQ